MPNRTRKRHLLHGFVGLSLAIHLHFALLIAAAIALDPDGCKMPDASFAPLEVALVPEEEINRPTPEDPLKEKLEKEEKEEEKKEKDIKGQVVELPPPLEEKRPDKSRFLSEYDSKVDKETKGPPVPFRPGKVISRRQLAPRDATPPPSPKTRQQVERKVMKLAMRTTPDLPESQLEREEEGEEPARVEQPKRPVIKGPSVPPSPKASPKKQLSLKDLKLSDRELAKAVGSPVNDYLKDVADGRQTLLNSKRWRFASFFNRVKRQVAQNWHPDVVYRRRDPQGNVYGFKDRLTILRVRLSPEGKLRDLHLEKACGVGFLDDEAISAFRAAEPFPNPPKGLVDKETGMISFRFGFLFEISRRPNFRIFRFKN
jgi:TonB family protein